MISENEHLRQRMLFSRLDDEGYLVTPEMFGSKEDYFFVIVSMILEVKILIMKTKIETCMSCPPWGGGGGGGGGRGGGGGGGGGVLPMMAYTGRLHPKGVSFSGFTNMKG